MLMSLTILCEYPDSRGFGPIVQATERIVRTECTICANTSGGKIPPPGGRIYFPHIRDDGGISHLCMLSLDEDRDEDGESAADRRA